MGNSGIMIEAVSADTVMLKAADLLVEQEVLPNNRFQQTIVAEANVWWIASSISNMTKERDSFGTTSESRNRKPTEP